MSDARLIYATCIMAGSTAIAAMAAGASAYYARRSVNEQKKSFEKQLREYKLTLSAETALKFESKFNDLNFKRIRSRAATALLNQQNETETDDVFDFFDTLGLFVRLGALTEEIAYAIFFHWVNLYWKAGRRRIGAEQKDRAAVWKDFEFLYSTVCEIERRRHADSEDLRMPDSRLKQQLQEEVTVKNPTHFRFGT